MPLYDYTCPDGHRTELVRPIGTEFAQCGCGKVAHKSQAHRVRAAQPATDTRGMFRRFTEAATEMDHAYTKVETDRGITLESPPLWKAAKAKAAAMVAAGEGETHAIR